MLFFSVSKSFIFPRRSTTLSAPEPISAEATPRIRIPWWIGDQKPPGRLADLGWAPLEDFDVDLNMGMGCGNKIGSGLMHRSREEGVKTLVTSHEIFPESPFQAIILTMMNNHGLCLAQNKRCVVRLSTTSYLEPTSLLIHFSSGERVNYLYNAAASTGFSCKN